jgi:8-oxo-dGTP pyrophosphatase MutT (NUDIX family)
MKFKQFAALPYRMRDAGLEILLITTRKKRRWSVPKGWPIKRSAPHQTAATEAYEEAGVYGKIGKSRVGQFKKRRLRKTRPVLCEVQIFPLEVKGQQGNWPEKNERTRIWTAPRQAVKLVRKAGLRRAIKTVEASVDLSDRTPTGRQHV